MRKNLHMSKKSSTFASEFKKYGVLFINTAMRYDVRNACSNIMARRQFRECRQTVA